MEIFNVHLFEFILIAGLALVLFGPERLPEIGRFAGRQVAKFLAWQQQSPELQMINEMRNEFEREIAQLRDELIRTRQQLDVQQDMQAIADEVKAAGQQAQSILDEVKAAGQQAQTVLDEAKTATKPVIRPPAQPPVPAATVSPTTPTVSVSAVVQPVTEEDRKLFGEPSTITTPPEPVADQPLALPDEQSTASSTPADPHADQPAITAAELHELMHRLNELEAELQAIVFQLQARGLLDQHWQPTVSTSPVTEETIRS
jgi:sec-independent protein translocase protein TatB